MSKKSHYAGKKTRAHLASGTRSAVVREVPVYEPKIPVEYGKPFIVMEDGEKNTFAYNGSAWVSYKMTMAECKLECQVKELPQKVNGKVRFEVREPIAKK
jgi:hypothetical protein